MQALKEADARFEINKSYLTGGEILKQKKPSVIP